MDKPELMLLDLRSSLDYAKISALPSKLNKNDDFLLCYELDPVQSSEFEPQADKFLSFLLFFGQKTADSTDKTAERLFLSAGKYLFVQYRNTSGFQFKAENWLHLAIEQQKDGLWQRHKMTNCLFVRFLFEDGGYVIQFFRPIS